MAPPWADSAKIAREWTRPLRAFVPRRLTRKRNSLAWKSRRPDSPVIRPTAPRQGAPAARRAPAQRNRLTPCQFLPVPSACTFPPSNPRQSTTIAAGSAGRRAFLLSFERNLEDKRREPTLPYSCRKRRIERVRRKGPDECRGEKCGNPCVDRHHPWCQEEVRRGAGLYHCSPRPQEWEPKPEGRKVISPPVFSLRSPLLPSLHAPADRPIGGPGGEWWDKLRGAALNRIVRRAIG